MYFGTIIGPSVMDKTCDWSRCSEMDLMVRFEEEYLTVATGGSWPVGARQQRRCGRAAEDGPLAALSIVGSIPTGPRAAPRRLQNALDRSSRCRAPL